MRRLGTVQQQDIPNGRVRVLFPHYNMVSYWLEVEQLGTQNDKHWWMPDIGEQVICDLDGNAEEGSVRAAVYSSVDTPSNGMTADKRNLTLKDGTVFEYDRSSHTLTVNLPPSSSTINITVNGPCNITSSNGNISASASNGDIDVTAHGAVNITAQNSSVTLSAPNGNVALTPTGGDVTLHTNAHTDSINSMIGVFNAHVHTDPSEGNTGAPTTQMT